MQMNVEQFQDFQDIIAFQNYWKQELVDVVNLQMFLLLF